MSNLIWDAEGPSGSLCVLVVVDLIRRFEFSIYVIISLVRIDDLFRSILSVRSYDELTDLLSCFIINLM